MFKKKRLILLIALIAVIAIIATQCGKSPEVKGDQEEVTQKEVQVLEIVQADTVDSKFSASGAVTPVQHSVVRSMVPGTVEFLIPVGQEVLAGDSLFVLRDSNIENNYFNAVSSFQQTQALSEGRVTQAELGLNSAKARLNLAEKSLNLTKTQIAQATSVAKNSALTTYRSAVSSLNQIMTTLSTGTIDGKNFEYAYEDLITSNVQLVINANNQFEITKEIFLTLKPEINLGSADADLNEVYNILLEVKNLVDKTYLNLRNAIGVTDVTGEKAIIAGLQLELNQTLSAVLGAKTGIENSINSGDLAILQSQGQYDLAKIDFDNATIGLESAIRSSGLELTASQGRMNATAYSFNNLTYPSPFDGIVLSHQIGEGEQAGVGQALIEVGNLDIMEVTVEVDSGLASKLMFGDAVLINGTIDGFISEIEPVGSLGSGKSSITVQNMSNELNAGRIAEIEFTLTNILDDGFVVPIGAVTITNNGNYVLVAVDGKAEKRTVETGEAYGDKIAIVSGLEEGDKVVLPNGVFINSGDSIKF